MTGNELIQQLRNDDDFLARALVTLKNRQTATEQRIQKTFVDNDRGFRPCHAKMGVSMAQFYERNGYLSTKQANWWRVRGKEGPRIAIYWKQLYNALSNGEFPKGA